MCACSDGDGGKDDNEDHGHVYYSLNSLRGVIWGII